MLYGVDVHARYQGGLDVPLLARQGYSFLVTKLSEGTAIPSVTGFSAAAFKARALTWLDLTRAAGMIPGAYHWLNAQDGAAQARFFYGLVREAGGPEGMLIQCDNEADATWQVTQDWAAEWKRLSGGHPWLMYTGRWWWGPRGWPGATLTPYLWDSRYLTADTDTIPDDPEAFASRIPADWWRLPNRWPDPTSFGYGGWTSATNLQFTSRGDAGSLANNMDLNATRLTRAQLLALTTTGGIDMTYEQADRNVAIATTYRALALVQGRDARYRIPGETADRVEINAGAAALGRIEALAKAIAARVDIDPTELAAITAAAEAGAHAGAVEAAEAVAAAVVAKLPPDGGATAAEVSAAVRDVLLHGAAPAAG